MKKIFRLPTGYLFTDEYSTGLLETLVIGDYGKSLNVKADFLGYKKKINGVPDGYCMPLSEKIVVTLSTEYGCSQNCLFCDCPKIEYKGVATYLDLATQFCNAVKLFPNLRYTERLNVHFARCGEPTYNENVIFFAEKLYMRKQQMQEELGLRIEVIHPVLTTSLPKNNKQLEPRLLRWIDLKNNLYNGQAGLQISVNSTNEDQRSIMFSNGVLTLKQFSKIAENFPNPIGRKYCLNFAYDTTFEVDGKLLANLFDPNKFMCKITPIHDNNACKENNIKTIDGYSSYLPYEKPEEELKAAGFDVLVFIPRMDEEKGGITCGNLILGGSKAKESDTLKIIGE
jgi:23S rRNA (adenine2503-C2)-methyltransferase